MKQFIFAFCLMSVLSALPQHASAQNPQTFERAVVEAVQEQENSSGTTVQRGTAQIRTGEFEGNSVEFSYQLPPGQSEGLQPDDGIILIQTEGPDGFGWYATDHYRLPWTLALVAAFVVLAFILIGKRALSALGGLSVSVLVLGLMIIPAIAHGYSPTAVAVVGGALIMVVSLFLSHGFSTQTTIAFVAILITIIIASIAAALSVSALSLTGTGTDVAVDLTFFAADLNLKGLLLAGIIIGMLGVLDDITATLVESIHQIHTTDTRLTPTQLYTKGMAIGKEHIISLINTLVLAYAGVSLPLLVLFSVDQQPLWITFNSSLVSEELVRTLVGSAALLLAVPLTTWIASRVFGSSNT